MDTRKHLHGLSCQKTEGTPQQSQLVHIIIAYIFLTAWQVFLCSYRLQAIQTIKKQRHLQQVGIRGVLNRGLWWCKGWGHIHSHNQVTQKDRLLGQVKTGAKTPGRCHHTRPWSWPGELTKQLGPSCAFAKLPAVPALEGGCSVPTGWQGAPSHPPAAKQKSDFSFVWLQITAGGHPRREGELQEELQPSKLLPRYF